MSADIKIMAEPSAVPAICKFTVDRPIYPEQAFFFGSHEAAEGSPLPARLFAIPGVVAVLVSHNTLTVTKQTMEPWQTIARLVGGAIREHIQSGELAVNPALRETIPPQDELFQRVRQVIEREVMPAVRQHGGEVAVVGVEGNSVFIRLGGGCHGCSSATVTLKQTVEMAIRRDVPQVGDIIDTTDHASGRNPYYTGKS